MKEQIEYTLWDALTSLAAIFLFFGLLVTCGEADADVIVGAATYHYDRDIAECELNPTLGVDSKYVVGYVFQSSNCEVAGALAAQYPIRPWLRAQAGAAVGGGYDGGWRPYAALVASPRLSAQWSVDVMLVPSSEGFVGLMLRRHW